MTPNLLSIFASSPICHQVALSRPMGHLAVNLVSCSSAAGQEVTTLQSQDVNLKSSVYMCSDSWASLLARPPRISKSSAHFYLTS